MRHLAAHFAALEACEGRASIHIEDPLETLLDIDISRVRHWTQDDLHAAADPRAITASTEAHWLSGHGFS